MLGYTLYSNVFCMAVESAKTTGCEILFPWVLENRGTHSDKVVIGSLVSLISHLVFSALFASPQFENPLPGQFASAKRAVGLFLAYGRIGPCNRSTKGGHRASEKNATGKLTTLCKGFPKAFPSSRTGIIHVNTRSCNLLIKTGLRP